MKNVNQTEWNSLLENDENTIVIDVRTQNEWFEGVQENAILMDVMQSMKFEQFARQLDKSKNYYVYCRSGQRSIKACSILESTGIGQTYNLLGGMLAWNGKTVTPVV